MDEILGIYSEELVSIIFKRGDGIKEPVRLVKQYRKINDKNMLFEIDPYKQCE